MPFLTWSSTGVALLLALASTAAAQPTQPNVLWIYLEDTNMDLGTFGHPVVQTPNIDRLAARGTKFGNTYCALPLCNPARVATMCGQRPLTTGYFRNTDPYPPNSEVNGVPLVPKFFHQAGYMTGGVGKIFHGSFFDPAVWHESYRTGSDMGIPEPPNPEPGGFGAVYWGPYENGPDGSLGRMHDTKGVDETLDMMSRFPDPFFIAMGFKAPHLPLIYPEAYEDTYDPFVDVPPLPPEEFGPWKSDVGPYSYFSTNYLDPTYTGSAEDGRRESLAAYWTTITWVDDEIGRLLDGLDAMGLTQNTIVVLTSDHGWSNGVHCRYGKQRFWEQDSRVPLIIAAPWLTEGHGTDAEVAVEQIDIYPTLAALCGLPAPEGLEGRSLVPLLRGHRSTIEPTTAYTYTFANSTHGVMSRSGRYKVNLWPNKPYQELYDLQQDPGEYRNLFYTPGYEEVIQAHREEIHRRDVLPATASTYGTGLAGTLGTPSLTAVTDPELATRLELYGSSSLDVPTFGYLYVGLQSDNKPMMGGRILVRPRIVQFLPIQPSGLAVGGNLPQSLTFQGLSLYMQLLIQDPGAPAGFAMSPGLSLCLGS